MRRIAALAVTVAVSIAMMATMLAGCGSSSPSADVKVTGTFGKNPAVNIPQVKPDNQLVVKTMVKGTGPQLGQSDAFVGNYVGYVWSGTKSTLKVDTFTQSTPSLFPPGAELLKGLKQALVGQRAGSRVLAVIPPADGYGTQGNPQGGIKATDTLVFVVDLIKAYGATSSAGGQQVSRGGGALPTVGSAQGAAPSVTIPNTAPPTTLTVRTLIQGSGPKVAKGQLIVVQYVGMIWASKKVFDSSWRDGAPLGFTVGATPEQVIPGWDKGLVGQNIGSRVLLVLPPADGYGKSGNSQAGIKGTDTLVFVVDILGAYGPAST
ncbi:MAG TPA: FKBP-type peptidyl-prolyl cis-trans isomerase [Streptosporangiaceae bacterium]|nr:FKBP-type peptidyl-prolyl cis-trans isomerase [Streptosporangiaceae bacterium]